ncbi:MAG: hypothetical protein QOC73_1225, partial [Actinomycetota bacterium]|nr:hypothetical protein [Actinomycetota bacterium]
MHGLVTIGASAGVAELEVAAAICAAASVDGSVPAAFVASAVGRPALEPLAETSVTPLKQLAARAYEVAAPPMIAARHAGAELLREPLLEAAREAAAGADLLVVA